EVDAADPRSGRLGRGGESRRVRQGGDRRGSEPEPVLAGELHLPKLVADHQLLDLGEGRSVDDRLDEPAIAGVCRDASGRRMRVVEEARQLELGEDVANRGAGHTEVVALDERLAADGRRGGDVFLNDGPENRLCAKVQWAAGATNSTRQGLVLPF